MKKHNIDPDLRKIVVYFIDTTKNQTTKTNIHISANTANTNEDWKTISTLWILQQIVDHITYSI